MTGAEQRLPSPLASSSSAGAIAAVATISVSRFADAGRPRMTGAELWPLPPPLPRFGSTGTEIWLPPPLLRFGSTGAGPDLLSPLSNSSFCDGGSDVDGDPAAATLVVVAVMVLEWRLPLPLSLAPALPRLLPLGAS